MAWRQRDGSGRRRHHRVRETPGQESSRLVPILLEWRSSWQPPGAL